MSFRALVIRSNEIARIDLPAVVILRLMGFNDFKFMRKNSRRWCLRKAWVVELVQRRSAESR